MGKARKAPPLRKKLSQRTIAAIKPPAEGSLTVWDTELKRFGLRVLPSGRKTFILKYRNPQGDSRQVTVGRLGPLTPDKARRRASRLLRQVDDGRDPAEERQQTRKTLTVADLAARYLEQHAQLKKKPASWKNDEGLLRLYILPAFGRHRVPALSRRQVSDLHHSMRDKPYQANRVLALLSKMLNLAEKWGLRADGSNPCRHVERYPEKRRERFLSASELARLGEVLMEAEANDSEHPSSVAALRLLILTGCRRNEILELQWEQVDFDRGLLWLAESKTGPKVVPLGAAALELLATLPRLDGNPFVCFGEKEGGRLVGLQKPWVRLRKRASLEDVRLHDLRHSFASVGAGAGLSLPIIGKLLGHTQAATTQRYAHLAADPSRQAADRISGEIAATMNGSKPAEVVRIDR